MATPPPCACLLYDAEAKPRAKQRRARRQQRVRSEHLACDLLPGGGCLHCGRPKGKHKTRGLCRRCCETPAIRDRIAPDGMPAYPRSKRGRPVAGSLPMQDDTQEPMLPDDDELPAIECPADRARRVEAIRRRVGGGRLVFAPRQYDAKRLAEVGEALCGSC